MKYMIIIRSGASMIVYSKYKVKYIQLNCKTVPAAHELTS